ncbi:hypothetical protein ACKVEX_14835 [Rhodocyclaceae bacterium SMB388]
MKNPWTKKNPLMSMWLSAANSMIGQARGQATATVKRESAKAVTAATNEGVKQVTDFWTTVLTPPKAPRKARTRKQR